MGNEYGGHKGAHAHGAATPLEEYLARELARRAEWAARPDVIEREAIKARGEAERAAERLAKRKRRKIVQTTDYPWLKPGWEW